MSKAIVNFVNWLLIKSIESNYASSCIEIENAANKVVLFNIQNNKK